MVLIVAAIILKPNCMTTITTINLLVDFSSFENFDLEFTEFIITLVSWPVKTTIPYIYSVFLKELPLKRT